ncbi:MAG: hypothetical protein K6G47_08095 [Clostridia bacterium]|nr:hypothetical protein [Clostridia bacterium]
MDFKEILKELEISILKCDMDSLRTTIKNVLEDTERQKEEIRSEYQKEIDRLNAELRSKNDENR